MVVLVLKDRLEVLYQRISAHLISHSQPKRNDLFLNFVKIQKALTIKILVRLPSYES